VLREVGADKIRAFSSFPDLLQHFVDLKLVKSSDDLLKNRPDLLYEILFRWYRQGQIGCVFARQLAHDPKKAQWRSEIVEAGFKVDALNKRIDELAPDSAALQLIFPGLTTAKHAAELVAKLCTSDRWAAHQVGWKFKERGRSFQVGLRWDAADKSYTSWVLGVADFEPMPFTRRLVGAPFTALVFRPSAPADFAPATDAVSGLPAAHLAHMNDGFGTDETLRKKIKQMTIDAKQELLGSDLWATARAQITFTFPLWCRPIVASVLKALPPDDADVEEPVKEK
jgi:hypothetical protein